MPRLHFYYQKKNYPVVIIDSPESKVFDWFSARVAEYKQSKKSCCLPLYRRIREKFMSEESKTFIDQFRLVQNTVVSEKAKGVCVDVSQKIEIMFDDFIRAHLTKLSKQKKSKRNSDLWRILDCERWLVEKANRTYSIAHMVNQLHENKVEGPMKVILDLLQQYKFLTEMQSQQLIQGHAILRKKKQDLVKETNMMNRESYINNLMTNETFNGLDSHYHKVCNCLDAYLLSLMQHRAHFMKIFGKLPENSEGKSQVQRYNNYLTGLQENIHISKKQLKFDTLISASLITEKATSKSSIKISL